MAKPAGVPAEIPPSWAVYFAVSDADDAAARINQLGGRTELAPTDIEPGRIAVAADPTGAIFSILAVKPAA
jgi:predicted enzyme related to lactoylglutathione lyase